METVLEKKNDEEVRCASEEASVLHISEDSGAEGQPIPQPTTGDVDLSGIVETSVMDKGSVERAILLDASSGSEEDMRMMEERVLSNLSASTSSVEERARRENPGTSTLHSLAFSIEETTEEYKRPNNILKKMLEWSNSVQYKIRIQNLKGLASMILNEKTFTFLEEGHGLTIDKNNRLTPTGKAIMLDTLFFVCPSKVGNESDDNKGILILSELDDSSFLDVLGAKFGMTGKQVEKSEEIKKSQTERLLDEFAKSEAGKREETDHQVGNIMAIRRQAIIEKTSLVEILIFLINESMNAIDKRLLLFASTKSTTRSARPINSILIAFKMEGVLKRKTKVGDKLIRKLCISETDFMCRMNLSVNSIFSGTVYSNIETIVEMEVNLTQIRILSLYSSCRNSVGSITASMDEIMSIQDEAFQVILDWNLLDKMDDEEDYEVANFTDLMGIMALAGLKPGAMDSIAVSMMWSRSFYAVLRNVAEFKTLFKEKKNRQHLVDCLSLFYLIEPMVSTLDDRKTLLINIMLWAVFDEKRDVVVGSTRHMRWQSSLQISGQILWVVACLFDYDKWNQVDYKFLPLILLHNYCAIGKWSVSCYNMCQWLASILNLRSDRIENDREMIRYLVDIGMPMNDNDIIELGNKREVITKTAVLINALQRCALELNIEKSLIRRSRGEAAALLYHLISIVTNGHPFYVYTAEQLGSSDVNTKLATEFRIKVDAGVIDPTDYSDIIVELMQEAENGLSTMMEIVPAKEEIQEILVVLSCNANKAQRDHSGPPSEEVLGIVTSEGINQYQRHQDIMKRRINELACATSVTGQRVDDSLHVSGILTRLTGNFGTIVSQEICQIGDKSLAATAGYSNKDNVDTLGATLTLGETQLIGAVARFSDETEKPEMQQASGYHSLRILEGFSIDSFVKVRIDYNKINDTIQAIVNTRSAIGVDIRTAVDNRRNKNKNYLTAGSCIDESRIVDLVLGKVTVDVDEGEKNNIVTEDSTLQHNRFKVFKEDLITILGVDSVLFSECYLLRELNLPLLLVIIPVDVVLIISLTIGFTSDLLWDLAVFVHNRLVDINNALLGSHAVSSYRSLKLMSNLTMGLAVYTSCAWLFSIRTVVSGFLGGIVVCSDAGKEWIKKKYTSDLIPVRAKLVNWLKATGKKTNLKLVKSEEARGMVNVLMMERKRLSSRGKAKRILINAVSALTALFIIPTRVVSEIATILCLKITAVSNALISKIKEIRQKAASKIDEMRKKSSEAMLSFIDAVKNKAKNQSETEDVKKGKRKASDETHLQPTIEVVGLELDNIGIVEGITAYVGSKVTNFGITAVVEAVTRTKNTKNNSIVKVPDDAFGSIAEGLKTACVDIVSMDYIVNKATVRTRIFENSTDGCDSNLGITLIDNKYIVHSRHNSKDCSEGAGAMTIVKFFSLNVIFLDKYSFEDKDSIELFYTSSSTLNMTNLSYSAKEYLTTGISVKKKVLLGRITLLIDRSNLQETIVSASHMIPYGSEIREEDSYDGVDSLCCSWTICNEEEKKYTRDVIDLEEEYVGNSSPLIIKSEKYLGDTTPDYSFFVCNKGDYRGHSGGVIVDKRNRPIAICIKQVVYNGNPIISDSCAIIVGCKLDRLDSSLATIIMKGVTNCEKCNNTVRKAAEQNKICLKLAPKSMEMYDRSIKVEEMAEMKKGETSIISTGILERLCDLNKMKRNAYFLESLPRSLVMMRIRTILDNNLATKDFSEPAFWVMKLILKSLMNNKVNIFIICSNMLNLSVQCLMTCVGVEFKRVRNTHAVEQACKVNTVNRMGELLIMTIDDLIIDLIRNKRVSRNSHRDRCNIQILMRGSTKDNDLERMAVKMASLMSNDVIVKVWKLEPVMNTEVVYKHIETKTRMHSQNSGHTRMMEISSKAKLAWSEETERLPNGRVTIVTSASKKTSQEMLAAYVMSSRKMLKTNVTVINFASLSSEAVCASLVSCDLLCLSSWTSGEFTAGVHYNMQIDVISDSLEVNMVEEALNYKLVSDGKQNKKISLTVISDEKEMMVSAERDRILEIKMVETAKPKEVFLEEANKIINTATYSGRKIFDSLKNDGPNSKPKSVNIEGEGEFIVNRKEILDGEYVSLDKERKKTIWERMKNGFDVIDGTVKEFMMNISLFFRKKIDNFKTKMCQLKNAFMMRFRKTSKFLQNLKLVKCSDEKREDEEEFHNANDTISDSGNISNEEEENGKIVILVEREGYSTDESEKFPEKKRKKREGEYEGVGQNENDCSKKNRVGYVAKFFYFVKIKIVKVINKIHSFVDKIKLTVSDLANRVKHIGNKLKDKIKKNKSSGKTLGLECKNTYNTMIDRSKKIYTRIIKSIAVSIGFTKLTGIKDVSVIFEKILIAACVDLGVYEIMNCVNNTLGDIYWQVTSLFGAIISMVEIICQLTNKEIFVKVFDLNLFFGGEPYRTAVNVSKETVLKFYKDTIGNAEIKIINIKPIGAIIDDVTHDRRHCVGNILEIILKMFEISKRLMFKTRLAATINKLWQLISNRNFDSKTVTGVLKVIPCHLEIGKVIYSGGLIAIIISVIKLAISRTEEKMAMLGVITERKHLADNINLYLNDRTEYANLMRVSCLAYSAMALTGKTGTFSYISILSSISVIVDWMMSYETYGGLGLSLSHVISRTVSAKSKVKALTSGLAAWWEDGSTKKMVLNTIILLGKEEVDNAKTITCINSGLSRDLLVKKLLLEQDKEREGNAELINRFQSPLKSLNNCMKIIRSKELSSSFREKLEDENKVGLIDQNLLLNIDAVLENRRIEYPYDTITAVKDLYFNQCRYLGRLKELGYRDKRVDEGLTSQESVLMVAKTMWEKVIDMKTMTKWQAAGDSRHHVLIAIAERNDAKAEFAIESGFIDNFCSKLLQIVDEISDNLKMVMMKIDIHKINWINAISISNEKSTPGILTRNRTGCKLTASYLPYNNIRVEAMREIISNGDVDEENEIINVFAKRRIEKRKMSELIGKEVVITRTIQANECDYKTAIGDIFNLLDKTVKVTRSCTGVSVGMNFFIEFANDDELCKTLAKEMSEKGNLVAKRISLDHSSYDGSQRNWSIEALKQFRQKLVKSFIPIKQQKAILAFLESCYESLKCRVMITAQGDLFGITGQQMSGHATTSVDNSIKARCYCAAIQDEVESKTGWSFINQTIRVQGDDTKLEVICDKARSTNEELVKEVISAAMRKLGQNVKKEKIEIFSNNDASNFLSHYVYDCTCTLRFKGEKKITILKMPGRDYFDNINSIATTLKTGAGKKYRKELGLLAAKSASFLTMYIGDIYISSACCLILAYCLSEIKRMRKIVNKIVMAKDKLAYLLTSSDDIEVINVNIDRIFKLHGISSDIMGYTFESWIIKRSAEETSRNQSVMQLADNILSLLGSKGDRILKNNIKELKENLNFHQNETVKEVRKDVLDTLLATAEESLQLEIVNSNVAYEPYLEFKSDIRTKYEKVDKNVTRKLFIIDSDVNRNIKIAIVVKLLETIIGKEILVEDSKIEYLNESGFKVVGEDKGIIKLMNSKVEALICENEIQALLLGASISNCLNLVITNLSDEGNQNGVNNQSKTRLEVRKLMVSDLNLLPAKSFTDAIITGNLTIDGVKRVEERVKLERDDIVRTNRRSIKREFLNVFLK